MSSRSRSGLWPAPRVLFSLLSSLALVACGGGSGSGDGTYGITATVSGLEGNSVVLQVNGDAGIPVDRNGPVTLGYLAPGKAYKVTVKTYPTNPTELCDVFHGEGTIGHSAVQDVSVACSTHAITVLDRVPAPGSTNAWIHDPIVIRFSSPVDPSSVTADWLSVSAGGVALGRSISKVEGDPNALWIQLDAFPSVPADMKITLGKNIADANGNRLQVPTDEWRWQYSAWQAPGGVALQNVNATAYTWSPSVAVSSDGHIYVAFAEALPVSAGSGALVFQLIVKHWNPITSTWERLGNPLNVAATEDIVDAPSVAVDPTTRLPVVAFNEKHESVATVYVRRWNGSSWDLLSLGATAGLNGQPSMNANFPVLALGSNGHPVVAWQEATVTSGDGSPHQVLFSRWSDTGWDTPTALASAAGSDAVFPSIAADSSGATYVACTRTGGGAYQLVMSRITWDSGSPPRQEPYVNGASGTALRANVGGRSSVAVSHDAAFVAYLAGTPSATYVLRCTPLVATQSSPVLSCDSWGGALVGDPNRMTNSPSMAVMTVNGAEVPVVAWDEWTVDRTFGTFIAETWNGLRWSPMPGMPMPTDSGYKAHAPQLSFGDGQLVVVWREITSDTSTSRIFLKRYNQ